MPIDLSSTATSSRKQMRDSRQSTSAMQAPATLLKESVISGEDFRLAMRRLANGVSIISSVGPGGPLGVTGNRGDVVDGGASQHPVLLEPFTAVGGGGEGSRQVRGEHAPR
jgi:hypothetical protein